MPNALHNGTGIPIGNANHGADVHIRRHIDGAVRVTGHGRTQNRRVVMFIKQWKFQRIIKEIFIIFNIQVLMINIICRDPIQFLQQAALRLCHMKFSAKRLPSCHLDGIYMKILSAVKDNYNRTLGKSISLRKHAGIVTGDIIAAAYAAKNLNILPKLP